MIRLSELTPELREMVDDGKIKLRPAYEISFLSETLQEALLDSIESEVCTPSHSQARRMRIMSEEGTLTQEIIEQIMMEVHALIQFFARKDLLKKQQREGQERREVFFAQLRQG